MKDEDRVALARIVMTHREHIIALEPLGKGLLGTTLRYDYEVRDEKTYFKDIPSPRIKKDMVEIARHILSSKAGHFDARKFKDRYENALKKLVRRKASGKKIEVVEPETDKTNVINLMDALRNSVKGKRRGAGRKRHTARKAGRRRKAA
jgi:Ku protein